jgi:hypothetical protein
VKVKIQWKPEDVLAKLSQLEEIIMTLNETVAALAAKVSDQGTVIEAAITLIENLAAAKGDPAAVQAILDQVNLQSTALSGAVTANTPPVV